MEDSEQVRRLVDQVHALWAMVECTDDPAALKACFKAIKKTEQSIHHLHLALRNPVPEW
jgi:hypothetical protein